MSLALAGAGRSSRSAAGVTLEHKSHGIRRLRDRLPRWRSVGRRLAILDFYFRDVSEQSLERNRQSVEVGERIQHEDVAICESA